MRLIYLSPVPWNSFSQRPHKFVEWFLSNKENEVMWVNPYPARLPRLADFKRYGQSLDCEEKFLHPKLTVLHPFSLPIEPLTGSVFLNRIFWNSLIQKLKIFICKGKTVIVIGKPTKLSMLILQNFSECEVLYDAMDDFPEFFDGISKRSMQKVEKLIANRCDRLLVSSTKLIEKWSQYNHKITIIKNGLDPAVLSSLRLNQNNDRAIIGYVGTVASWFDWIWLINLAEKNNDKEFRIIGPVFEKPHSILPKNIKLIPGMPHNLALMEMKGFDVGLIPFVKNKLTDCVDPIKYYEYKALGVPVLSTNFGEMSYRVDELGVFISNGITDSSSKLNNALGFKYSADVVQKFRNENSWRSRFELLRLN